MDRRRRIIGASLLTLIAACLSAGLLAFIVIEAFDDDLDLWPFGAENFSVASPAGPVHGGQFVGRIGALTAVQCFVSTAGALLVRRYRARSAIPSDSPSPDAHLVPRFRARIPIATHNRIILFPFSVAEARGR